jgi:hypothetical protein
MIRTSADALFCARWVPEASLRNGLLGQDLVVPQRLVLALVVLVRHLLVLCNDLVHVDHAAGGDVVWRTDVHDPAFTLALCAISCLQPSFAFV